MALVQANNKDNWFKEEMKGVEAMISAAGAPGFFRPFSHFFPGMDLLFDQTMRNFSWPTRMMTGARFPGMPSLFHPNVDIASNENEYLISIEVPGMGEKDVRLDISPKGVLTISGEKKHEKVEDIKDIECAECSYGAFTRMLSLPEDADRDNIEATFHNGVLTIVCPRLNVSEEQSRKIPISNGRRSGENRAMMHERGGASQGAKKAA